MTKNLQQAISCLFFMISIQSSFDFFDMESECTTGKDFLLNGFDSNGQLQKIKINWNVEESFKNEEKGFVKEKIIKFLCIPPNKIYKKSKLVTVKKVEEYHIRRIELETLRGVSEKKFGIQYFGCHRSEDKNTYYIVQERMLGDLLNDIKIIIFFNKMGLKNRINYMIQLLTEVKLLFDDGRAHGDIKSDNMMIDLTKKKVHFIDFEHSYFVNPLEQVLSDKGENFLTMDPKEYYKEENFNRISNGFVRFFKALLFLEIGAKSEEIKDHPVFVMKNPTKDFVIEVLMKNGYEASKLHEKDKMSFYDMFLYFLFEEEKKIALLPDEVLKIAQNFYDDLVEMEKQTPSLKIKPDYDYLQDMNLKDCSKEYGRKKLLLL